MQEVGLFGFAVGTSEPNWFCFEHTPEWKSRHEAQLRNSSFSGEARDPAEQYWRREKAPWSVSPREPFPMSAISNCQSIGEDSVGVKQTNVYEFDRRFAYGIARARMWVAKDIGLPVKAYV